MTGWHKCECPRCGRVALVGYEDLLLCVEREQCSDCDDEDSFRLALYAMAQVIVPMKLAEARALHERADAIGAMEISEWVAIDVIRFESGSPPFAGLARMARVKGCCSTSTTALLRTS